MKRVLVSMSVRDDPNERPECSQVLSEYNLWSIHENCLKTDPTFESTLNPIQQNDYKYCADYLGTKLTDLEDGLTILHSIELNLNK